MTTPNQPDRMTAQELRNEFAKLAHYYQDTRAQIESLQRETGGLRTDIETLSEELHTMRGGLQQAATAPAQVGTFSEMMIDTIVMTYSDEGKPVYKGLGAPFQKFGVRIWDEILPQFTDPATLKPGKNAIQPTPARVLMNTPEEGKTAQPRKVTGKV